MVHVDETGKTTFTFRHTVRGPVYLVGDFCQWQIDHLPMRRVNGHEWMLMLRLPPGVYEFRYLAEGKWFTDFAAFGLNRNHLRDFNSVLRVPRMRPAVHEPTPENLRVRVRRGLPNRLAASA
jgi:hypothetical protein